MRAAANSTSSHCESSGVNRDLQSLANDPVCYQLKKDKYSSHSAILDRLRGGHGKRLLDVGAAQGDFAELLTREGYEVVALEADPHLAALAERKCRRVVVTDLDKAVPDLGGPFDVAVFADVLEHLKDPIGVLQQIIPVVKPNGSIIISVPNIAHIWVRLQLLRGKFEYMNRGILDRTHLRFFTMRSFTEMLRTVGLQVLELGATPVPLPIVVPKRYQGALFNVLHGASAVLARCWKPMFAYQFIAVTRRITRDEA